MTLALEALRDLRANRVRAALTGLSMLLAVMSIVAILCAGSIVRDVFVAQEEQADGRAVTMATSIPTGDLSPAVYDNLSRALQRRIGDHGGAFAIEEQMTGRAGPMSIVSAGGLLPDLQYVALAGRLDHVRRLPIVAGHWFSRGVYPPQIVLNQAAAAQFGAVGTQVALQPAPAKPAYPVTVVGIIADGSRSPTVFTSIASMLNADPAVFDGQGPPEILAHRRDTNEATMTSMLDAAAGDIGIDPGTVDVVRNDKVAQLTGRLHATQDGFLGAAIVALIVAIVGLLNIGLASVRERGRELVVRRAIGATRARIFGLVLLSAIVIAVVSCIIALATATAVVYGVVPALISRASAIAAPAFPWSAAAAGVATALFGALIGAAYPALVAARIDMALALRD